MRCKPFQSLARWGDSLLDGNALSGTRVLILEDEFLIAMDVEQLCRDHGAADVEILRNVVEADAVSLGSSDVAIIDVMVGGRSSLDFAGRLRDSRVPFIFASGYGELDGVFDNFPEITVVGKPYVERELIGAVVRAMNRAG